MADKPRPVCLLTGASGRLGSALCPVLAPRTHLVAQHLDHHVLYPSQHQHDVWVGGGSAPRVERPPVYAVRANLLNDGDLEGLVKITLERFGRIDWIVNAAVYSYWGRLADRRVVDTALEQYYLNAVVPVKLALAALGHGWQSAGRAINTAANRCVVNISSTAATTLYPDRGQSAYAASKAALNAFTVHLAAELAPVGVRVNAICPNAFPSRTPTETVCAAVLEACTGSETSQLVELNA